MPVALRRPEEKREEELLRAVPKRVEETVVRGERHVREALAVVGEAYNSMYSTLPSEMQERVRGSFLEEVINEAREHPQEMYVRFSRTRNGAIYSISAFHEGRRVFLTLMVGRTSMRVFLADREGNVLEELAQEGNRVRFWQSPRV